MTSESGKLRLAADVPSNELFAGLLEMVSDLVWSLAVDDQRTLYVNPAAARVFGRPLSELGERPELWLSCVQQEDRIVLQQNLSRIGDLHSFAQEFRITHPNSEPIWLKGRFRLIFNSAGVPVFIGATAKDVTKRIAAERKLEESQAIYHSLVESLPINVFRKDRDGRIVFANKRYCDELNTSLKELLGKTDMDLFPEMAPKYLKDDAWVLQTGLPFHDIEGHPRGPHDMIYVEVLKAPVTDSGGRRIGIQGMFWDVTERKNAEKALRDAKELAESASRAKTDFLANVSHEIRTPMNGIIGITELLVSSVHNKEHREYLELIQTSADSLLALINDILDFSKIEAGKVQLESKRFQLRDTLGDTFRSLAVRAHAKQLELIVSFAANVPDEIVGDLVRLRQIVVNLISNAVKFTHQGQVEFSVECLGRKDGVATLQFVVKDSGIGIPEDKLELIFSEFEQADSSTTRQYGGTGLGLAIASRLVALMHGILKVESQLNVGSKFSFSANFHIDQSALEEGPLEGLSGHRILVVVKNEKLRINLEETLKRSGLLIYAAANAKESLSILKSMAKSGAPISLVLADAELSFEDGSFLIGWIRDLESITHTRVILLCQAMASEMSVDRTLLGIDEVLIKPVKEKDLLDSIALALGILGPETTAHSSAEAQSGVPVSQLQVLLAEDNLVNQKLTVALLEKHGHIVEVANNGRQAVLLYQQKHFDLILMDVQMPEVDGYQATREIRQLQIQLRQRVPIIALTAHASPVDRQRCLAAGMDEYISKPIRAKELYAMIEKQTGHLSTFSSGGATAANTNLVDWEHAFETVGGDRQLLEELIRVFLKDQAQILGNMENAIERNDDKELRLTAHSIKSALTHLGGRLPAKFAADLEMMGQNEDLKNAKSVLEEFRQSLSLTTDEMLQFVGGS